METAIPTSVEKAEPREIVHFTPEEREAAILQYTPFAKAMARNFWLNTGTRAGLADYQSEAVYGLCIAAKKYDKNNPGGAQFLTYAVWWIRQRLSKHSYKERSGGLRGVTQAIRDADGDTDAAPRLYCESQCDSLRKSRHSGLHDDTAGVIEAFVVVEPSCNPVDETDSYLRLIRYVPAEYREILWDAVVIGKTSSEIGRERGVSRTRINQLLNYCFNMVRRHLNDYTPVEKAKNGRKIRRPHQVPKRGPIRQGTGVRL